MKIHQTQSIINASRTDIWAGKSTFWTLVTSVVNRVSRQNLDISENNCGEMR